MCCRSSLLSERTTYGHSESPTIQTGIDRTGENACPTNMVEIMSADVSVIGSGVFGAWTALYLRRMGMRVRLYDAFGAGHSRSSSGGETRLIRAGYAQDEIYTRMAMDSLAEWKA